MDNMKEIEKDLMRKDVPNVKVGDTVRVFVKIKEGDKTRSQAFEGIVIDKKGSGLKGTFAVRRVSYGEGIERIFQLHSPLIDSIKVIKKGKVKKAALYYLRKKVGKHTKIEEEMEFDKHGDALLGEKGVS